MSCNLQKLVGLKVVSVKGFKRRENQKTGIKADAILFSDKRTVLWLNKQDYSLSARELNIMQDAMNWKQIMEGSYMGDATEDW